MIETLAIVGLGNPGFEYSETRHNVGFMVVDFLHSSFNFPKWTKKPSYDLSFKKILGRDIYLVKPTTYMNLSGIGVKNFLTDYSFDLHNILVVHDDLDLEVGRIRIKYDGKDGGHKGIRSIVTETGSQEFYRLRIGIDKPSSKEEVVEYVLSNFTSQEKEVIDKIIKLSPNILMTILEEGWEKAQNLYNRKCII